MLAFPDQVLAEPKLAIILQPLLRAGGGGGSGSGGQGGTKRAAPGDASDKPSKSKRRKQALKKAEAEAASALAAARGEASKWQAKAAAAKAQAAAGGQRGKGAGKRGGPNLPAELFGKSAISADGRNMCYGFNMASGCTKAQPGQKCDRGWHGCMEPLPDGTACGKPHPCANH